MPTEWEMGFAAGWRAAHYESVDWARKMKQPPITAGSRAYPEIMDFYAEQGITGKMQGTKKTKKRKLSKWQQFVKANSKKKKYVYQGGGKKGKLNLKKMGVDYRKKNR